MNRRTIKGILLLLSCLLIIGLTGCEYDAPTPAYNKAYVQKPAPSITQLNPDQAAPAGVNTITIQGANFASTPESNKVYFGSFNTEIVSASDTSMVVRRPNVTGAVTVSVITEKALEIARYTNYSVDTVAAAYGSFVDNKQITAIAVDREENVYVSMFFPRTVYKVPSGGQKVVVSDSTVKRLTDMVVGPDGFLYLFNYNYAWVSRLNLADGVEADWSKPTKKVICGDFDQYGNLYAGGSKSDLFVISPDGTPTAVGVYAKENIKDIRVYNNTLYVESELPALDPIWAIWKQPILDAAGNLGERELVLDRTSALMDYATSLFKAMAISEAGDLYIATNQTNPIMFYDRFQNQDILYKYIIPSTSDRIVWGGGNYIYMIQTGTKWDLIRIDMGIPGASCY